MGSLGTRPFACVGAGLPDYNVGSLSYQLNDIFVGGINNIVTINVSKSKFNETGVI